MSNGTVLVAEAVPTRPWLRRGLRWPMLQDRNVEVMGASGA
jgi:hypothetical protein